VVADNSEFFDSLFYGHQKALHAYLIGQTGDPDNAEDLLQQVFVRVWQHIEVAKQKPTEGLRYWLFAIASNIKSFIVAFWMSWPIRQSMWKKWRQNEILLAGLLGRFKICLKNYEHRLQCQY
jgi:hypothetical protein